MKAGARTHPSDGTIELRGALGSIIVKPQVANNAISLQVVGLTALGLPLAAAVLLLRPRALQRTS
jgi:hypothetical protein